MKLFELFGTIAVDHSEASRGMDAIADKASGVTAVFEKVGSAALAVGKTIATGVAAGTAAVGALAKSAVEGYADYEQLVGGVETLFGTGGKTLEEYAASVGKSAQLVEKGVGDYAAVTAEYISEVEQEYNALISAQNKVLDYASDAYKTAGLSANEYMETVTSFSASLLQGLGGDTDKAADVANRAITDMADNANKMGTSISMIQNAYQGFAKQNYTMLDNLKLGYGGTQAEMARLINDSGVLGDTITVTAETVNEVSFDKIIEAIGVIQDRMGITGTTAKEASETIAGSLASAKASWQNLLVGMADENADMEKLIDQFVDSVGTAAQNIIPRVEIALDGAGKLIDRLFPIILDKIPAVINDALPKILDSAVSIVRSLVDGISGNQDTIMKTIFDVIMVLIRTVTELLPQIFDLGMELLVTIAQGIVDNLDELVSSAVEVVEKILETITDPDTLALLLDAALEIIFAIADGVAQFLPKLTDAAIGVVRQLVATLTENETLERLLDAALEIILAIADGLVEFIPELITATVTIIEKLIEFFLEEDNLNKLIDAGLLLMKTLIGGLLDCTGLLMEAAVDLTATFIESLLGVNWWDVGKRIVLGIGEGIVNSWTNFQNEHSWAADALVKGVSSFAAGGTNSWQYGVDGSHAEGLDYVPYDGYVAELHKGEMVVPAAESEILRSGGGERLQRIIDLLEVMADYFPQLIETAGHDIVANDGAILARYAPLMNLELGRISTKKVRGR